MSKFLLKFVYHNNVTFISVFGRLICYIIIFHLPIYIYTEKRNSKLKDKNKKEIPETVALGQKKIFPFVTYTSSQKKMCTLFF